MPSRRPWEVWARWGGFYNLWMEEAGTQSSVLLKPQHGAGKEQPCADAPLCPGYWVSTDVYVYL